MKENSTPQREILINRDQIQKRITELAEEIAPEYKNKNLLLVGVLKGSFIFIADLVRELHDLEVHDLEIDFVEVQSYGKNKKSSKAPRITKDTSIDITKRNVILIEDISDTGYTLDYLTKIFNSRNPESLKTAVLVDKPSRRKVEVQLDYIGFTIENVWVEGYGLDTDQKFRGCKDIEKRIIP